MVEKRELRSSPQQGFGGVATRLVGASMALGIGFLDGYVYLHCVADPSGLKVPFWVAAILIAKGGLLFAIGGVVAMY
jgi:hypothetical protein